MASKFFNKGDQIEVLSRNGAVTWRPATYLHSTSPDQIHVLYDEADDRTACVSVDDVRPAPARDLHRYFKVGERVEGLCPVNKVWRKGEILEILENSRYRLRFECDDESCTCEVEQWEVRGVTKWYGGAWSPPLRHGENKSSESEARSRHLTLKIKFSKKPPEPKFKEGTLVEVKSDEEGFQGSWFIAAIVKTLENDKFLVEYRTLRTEDMTDLLKEEIDISCIRQCPPVVQRVKPFETRDRVDAWYNDGWWEGYIVQVLNYSKYLVHFPNGDEELEFEHCKLRPHQEWIDGKWSEVSKVSLTDVNLKSNEVKLKRKHSDGPSGPIFRNGMMVEVKSDEEGYQGSWYSAMIISSLSGDKYLVEYQALKTDDESELLKEKALASYIRPYPPQIVRVDRFKMLEEVDAWYNDGWWVGLVSKVLDGLKYAVYFWTTNEELEFQHFNLRPHQEWVGGKWIIAFRKKSKLLVSNKLRTCKEVGIRAQSVTRKRGCRNS